MMVARDSLSHISPTLDAKVENGLEYLLWDAGSMVAVVGVEQPQKVGSVLQDIVHHGSQSELRLSSCFG